MWHHWPVWGQDILAWTLFLAWCVILYLTFVRPVLKDNGKAQAMPLNLWDIYHCDNCRHSGCVALSCKGDGCPCGEKHPGLHTGRQPYPEGTVTCLVPLDATPPEKMRESYDPDA